MAVKNWLPKPVDGASGAMEESLKAVDIRDTLNHYGGSVSNNTTSYFSEAANINRWSKHKPIVTGKEAAYCRFIDFDDKIWDNQPGDAPIVYLGLTPNTADSVLKKEVWDGCSEDEWFQYALPTGKETQPFRLGDFRGYRADATSPFKAFTCDSAEIEPKNGTATFTLNMRYYLNNELDAAEGGMLSLKDMAVFKDEQTYTMCIITLHDDTYTVWTTGSSVTTADWGQMTGTIEIGMINNTNDGTYECAVALMDSTGTFYKLPFEHITLEANIYYENDYFGDISGDAYYTEWIDSTTNETKTNGYIDIKQTIHAGSVTTEGPEFSRPLYAGSTSNNLTGPLMSSSTTIEKGEEGTMSFYWNASDHPATWASYRYLLRDAIANGTNMIYVNTSSTGGVAIKVTGSVMSDT